MNLTSNVDKAYRRQQIITVGLMILLAVLIYVGVWVVKEYQEWRELRAVQPYIPVEYEYIPPAGWTLSEYQSYGRYSGGRWICERDGEFQTCTPTRIQVPGTGQ